MMDCRVQLLAAEGECRVNIKSLMLKTDDKFISRAAVVVEFMQQVSELILKVQK